MESIHRAIKIEVCIDSVESALAAVQGGAVRLEICANLALGGGTTPSIGLVRLIKRNCPNHIELMAMVRPRTGDFLYSSHEISIMLEDIGSFAEVGITGVVFGALNSDGTIDVEKTRMLVAEAVKFGMQVCFHRAFDMVVDQQKALSDLQSIPGITRILTSGGKSSVTAGLQSIVSLYQALTCPTESQSHMTPNSRTQIMPGSGINAGTVTPILRALIPLGCRSVHMSGGSFLESSMRHCPEGMGMGVGGAGEWGTWRTSENAVQAVREVVGREWEAYVATLG